MLALVQLYDNIGAESLEGRYPVPAPAPAPPLAPATPLCYNTLESSQVKSVSLAAVVRPCDRARGEESWGVLWGAASGPLLPPTLRHAQLVIFIPLLFLFAGES